MWVKILWIPAFAEMTEETDRLDKSNPYIYIDQTGKTSGLTD
jgi:hypothetical protein